MIITTPHYNRPECSALFVEYLSKCYDIGNTEVIFVVEPGNEDVLKICENANLPKYEVIKNESLLGLWETKKKCLEIGFERSDFVLHLEDDLLVARDTLLFYEWCRRSYAGVDNVFSANGFSKTPPFHFMSMGCPKCGTLPYSQVRLRPGFTSIGMAFWKNRYEKFKNGWDGSDKFIFDFQSRLKYDEVYPILSRINHIGFIQGKGYTKEFLKELFNAGHKPVGLSANSTSENPIMRNHVDNLHNSENREWVKLNNSNFRSRCSEEFYKDNYYLDMWAGNMEYELLQFKAMS